MNYGINYLFHYKKTLLRKSFVVFIYLINRKFTYITHQKHIENPKMSVISNLNLLNRHVF